MGRLTSPKRKRSTFRKRNYRVEYQRRIAKAIAEGKSVSVGRGHARAIDLPKPPASPINRDDAREKALKLMRHGMSQAQAAKTVGVTAEQLRRHRLIHTESRRDGGRWIIEDKRPASFWIASDRRMRAVKLANGEGSRVSAYWSAVNDFLTTNDAGHLQPVLGLGVRDVEGRLWTFETRPNELRKLDSVGELHFIEIYADVAK